MTTKTSTLAIEAQFRRETGEGIAVWIGDMEGLTETWVWLPKAKVERPNPDGRGRPEVFLIPEWLVIEKKLEGCVIDGDRPQQEDLLL